MMMSYFFNSMKETKNLKAISVTFAHIGEELKIYGYVYIHTVLLPAGVSPACDPRTHLACGIVDLHETFLMDVMWKGNV